MYTTHDGHGTNMKTLYFSLYIHFFTKTYTSVEVCVCVWIYKIYVYEKIELKYGIHYIIDI